MGGRFDLSTAKAEERSSASDFPMSIYMLAPRCSLQEKFGSLAPPHIITWLAMAEAGDISASTPGSDSDSFDKESHPSVKWCKFSQVERPPQVHPYDGGKDAWMTITGT